MDNCWGASTGGRVEDSRHLAELGRVCLEAPLAGADARDRALRHLTALPRSLQAQLAGQTIVRKGLEGVRIKHPNDQDADGHWDYLAVDDGSPDSPRPDISGDADIRLAALRLVTDHAYAEIQEQRSSRDGFTKFLPDYRDAQVVAASLEAMNAAAFVLDGKGVVRARTRAGEAIVQAGHTFGLKDGRLHGRRRDVDRSLQATIQAVLQGTPSGQVALRKQGQSPLFQYLEVFALPSRSRFDCEPRVLVTVREPRDLGDAHRALLEQMFEMTPAEADIAVQVANGLSREEIADRRGSTLATVQAQFKQIFRKTDVRREASLVALLNKLLR